LAFPLEGILPRPEAEELLIAGNKRRCFMFRQTLTRVGVPAVIATMMLTAGPAWAQNYGRGSYSASAGSSSGGGSARSTEIILKASGVPLQNGRVAWPWGLRLLGPNAQMQQLEAQLQLAVEQITAGGANPLLLDEIRRNVECLRQILLTDKELRFSMPLAVYDDAELFIQNLKRATQILAASAPAAQPEASAR
jgi:hypothetical protein